MHKSLHLVLTLFLAIVLPGCAELSEARLASARGNVTNASEKIYTQGAQGRKVLILVDATNQHKSIQEVAGSFGSALYERLRDSGYDTKQFVPENKEKMTLYMAKIQTDMERDPTMLVLQFIPRMVQIVTTEWRSGIKSTSPENIDFSIRVYQKSLTSPAYIFDGDWKYSSDSRFNILTEIIIKRLIKTRFLVDLKSQ